VSDNLSIIIKALLVKTAHMDIQKELDIIEKKLKPIRIKVTLDPSTNQMFERTQKSMNSANQGLSRYEKGLNNLIHLYKMKKISDQQFLETMEKMRSKTQFATLSNKKQEEVVRLLTQAERTYQRVVDEGTNINRRRATEQARIMNQTHRQGIEQQRMLENIRGLRGRSGEFIVGDNLTSLNALENRIRNLNPADRNFSRNMREARLELQRINNTMGIYRREVQNANRHTNIFGQSIFEAGNFLPHYIVICNCKSGEPRNLGCTIHI